MHTLPLTRDFTLRHQYDKKTAEFNSKIQNLHSDSNYKWLQQVLHKVHGVEPPRPSRDIDDLTDDMLLSEL